MLLRGMRLGSGGRTADVRVRGGLITDIGELAPVHGEQVIHQQGAVVLPGFVDGHVHAVQWSTSRRRVDVGAAGSPAEAVELLRVAAATAAPDEIAVAYGYRDGLWTHAPHKDLLERAFPGWAVAVMSTDLHAVWMSPSALARIGWDHPTGVLREQNCLNAAAVIAGQESTAVIDRRVVEETHSLSRRGVTEIIEYEYADNHLDWARRAATHEIGVRVRASVWRPWLDDAIAAGRRTGQPIPGTGGLVEVGPFKLIVDGSLNTRTAYCFDPYPDPGPGEERHGQLLIPEDELVALMTRSARNGLLPAVHAIGDHANAIVLSAFERVGCGGRIEHAQLVRPQDARRFARPGLVASVQPQHAMDDRDVADRQWPGRTGSAFPYARLLAAGARLEFGSDAPVAVPDPWRAIADAVHRTNDERPPWHGEQAIPLPAALAAASAGRPAVRVGDRADIAIAAHDPAHLTSADLREMPVLLTLVDGRPTYRDPGLD